MYDCYIKELMGSLSDGTKGSKHTTAAAECLCWTDFEQSAKPLTELSEVFHKVAMCQQARKTRPTTRNIVSLYKSLIPA